MTPGRTFTTLLIIAWCFLISLGCALVSYFFQSRRRNLRASHSPQWLMPTLVIAPLVLLAGFNLFEVNLIFPLYMDSTWVDIAIYTFFPALILTVASGLLTNIHSQIGFEVELWRSKPCSLVAKAYGKRFDKSFCKIIVANAMMTSWQKSLPWLCGEIIIVEVVFNIPGLGFEAWRYAKARDHWALAGILLSVVAVYLTILTSLMTANKWIGRRLESYH